MGGGGGGGGGGQEIFGALCSIVNDKEALQAVEV